MTPLEDLRPNQPHSTPPVDVMELTTAAEPQSPVEDPLDFEDVRSGVKEAGKDAHCAPSGVEQAEEATTNEQGTVAACPCPAKAPMTVQGMLAINPSPMEAPQPAPPRSLHRLQIAPPDCYDLIRSPSDPTCGKRACGCTQVQPDDIRGVALPCQAVGPGTGFSGIANNRYLFSMVV